MKVIPKGRLQFGSIRAAYPYQEQAEICVPDLLANLSGAHAQQMGAVRIDPVAGCAYAGQVLVPHNQCVMVPNDLGARLKDAGPSGEGLYKKAGLPTIVWDHRLAQVGGSLIFHYFRAAPCGNQYFDILWDGTGNDYDTWVLGKVPLLADGKRECLVQGFTATLERNLPGDMDKNRPYYASIHFVIGTHKYAVNFRGDMQATIWRAQHDGSEWGTVGGTYLTTNLPVGENSARIRANVGGGMGGVPVDVRYLNGLVQVAVGTLSNVFAFVPLGPVAKPYIDHIWFSAKYFWRVRCDVHLHKWETSSKMISGPIGLGTPPKTPPYYVIVGATSAKARVSGQQWDVALPPGSALTATTASPPGAEEHRYELKVTNAREEHGGVPESYAGRDYADATAVVTRVDTRVDSIWTMHGGGLRSIVPKNRVVEDITFDANALTMHHSLEFNVDNWRGQWAGMSGARAVALDLGYAAPATPYYRRFTGMMQDYAFSRPSANRSVATMHCTDLMPLFEQLLSAPPVMDGWNHYYAVSWVAQYCGLSRQQMAFSALVPDDPYSSAPGDPAPYFLPFGFGMRPWTPRDRMMPARALLDYIRKPSGFLLYFDAWGRLCYHKWLPTVAGPPAKVFTEAPSGPDGANLSEFWGLSYRTSVVETRNQVTLIGVDQWSEGWYPIIRRIDDAASVQAPPGAEPPNYKGYWSRFVWVDSRFANREFASESAERLYRILRLPHLEVQFTTWLQPQLFPMDVIALQESKTGAGWLKFYVMGVRNVWGIDPGGGVECATTVTGRFLLD